MTTATTMKAIRVEEYGDESKLVLKENVPIPQPGPDEVLIRVHAAGINPVDTYIRSGNFPHDGVPFTPGFDCAGVIEAVGESAKEGAHGPFEKGDRVLAVFAVSGSYAEYCTAKVTSVCRLHQSLSFTQGAAIGVPYYTAQLASASARTGTIKSGETVLVHGASGAVGIAAVQILKARGCVVIGTAGTTQGMELVKGQGADYVYNHREDGYIEKIRTEATGGRGVDAVLEMLASANLQHDMDLASWRGRIFVIGNRGSLEVDAGPLLFKELSIFGIVLLTVEGADLIEMHRSLYQGQTDGWLRPIVAKEYPLADASKGHHDVINNKGTAGKLVINLDLTSSC